LTLGRQELLKKDTKYARHKKKYAYYYITIKNLKSSRDTKKKVKRKLQRLGGGIVAHITNRRLASRIYNRSQYVYKKKTSNR